MTDSNGAKNFDIDSIKIALDNVANSFEKIKLGQNTLAISILSDTLSNFQAAVNTSNILGIIATSNVLSAFKLVNIDNWSNIIFEIITLLLRGEDLWQL